jgi:nitrilase
MQIKMLVSIAQISPVWLDKKQTIEKVIQNIEEASKNGAELICFGETFLPGYPFWLSFTGGSEFNSDTQKEIYSFYLSQSVNIRNGDLDPILKIAKRKEIAIYLGFAEAAQDRGGKTIYCSLAYIDQLGRLQSVHKKLVPTYEERLVWGAGDGNGLQVHNLNDFTLGGLNCWENWMPLTRTALYGLGEDLHIAVWPGSLSLTEKITPFIAQESRSFVISASSILLKDDIPKNIPNYELIYNNAPEILADGGSCIAKPDGTWLVKPLVDKEELIYAELNHSFVWKERQNFDPVGHYSRPDITKLIVDRERQNLVNFT